MASLRSFEGRGSLKGWLRQIATRVRPRRHRQRRRAPAFPAKRSEKASAASGLSRRREHVGGRSVAPRRAALYLKEGSKVLAVAHDDCLLRLWTTTNHHKRQAFA
jgi:DNA-directed RNA polymerase specialized sigma24 family protein